MVALPLLEPPSRRIDLVVIRLQPLGRGVVEHDRLDRRQDRRPHIEEAGARGPRRNLRPAAVSASSQLVDIERDLTGGLTGIEEIGDPVLAGDRTDAGGRIDQAAIGRDVVERDQRDGPTSVRRMLASSASRSISPWSLEGTTSTSMPNRRASWR